MADILHRWNLLLDLLQRQLKGGTNPVVIEGTRERIRRVAIDTDRRLVQLPKPHFEDPCFKGLRFGHPGALKLTEREEEDPLNERLVRRHGKYYLDTVKLPSTGDPVMMARAIMELERLRANSHKRIHEYSAALRSMRTKQGRLLAAAAAGRAYKPGSRGHGMKRMPCMCGCGEKAHFVYNSLGTVKGTYRYLRGHILRYSKLVAMVERGYARWEDLPDLLKRAIPWGNCLKCNGRIPLVDPWGEALPPDEHIGIVCWRTRMSVHWPYSKSPRRRPEIPA